MGSTEILRLPLGGDSCVVVDRQYDRPSKKHIYEVMVCSVGGFFIQSRIHVGTDRKIALTQAALVLLEHTQRHTPLTGRESQ
jgi:hypothetical protein